MDLANNRQSISQAKKKKKKKKKKPPDLNDQRPGSKLGASVGAAAPTMSQEHGIAL
jgi:hypothetical protein